MRRPALLLALLSPISPLALIAAAADPPPAAPFFDEREADWGLDFTHFNGMSGELYFVENMGAGVALVDYDGDGDLDVYLVQGEMLGAGKSLADATFPPAPGMLPLGDRLYRNDPVRTAGGGVEPRFVDVSERAGILPGGYGMGVATGDVDGDGAVDLYVTRFGANRLWRNRGDGTFEDTTARAGVDDPRWSVPSVLFDADGDGDLDLWVGNYVRFSTAAHNPCFDNAGVPLYCGPLSYEPETDRLFLNRGDGTFTDASVPSGVGTRPGNALGAVAADVDGDGRFDLYVANDQMPNFLWMSRGGGRFEDEALLAGCAVNAAGDAEASMGVDAIDVDGDGDEDLFAAHLTQETNTLYRNAGDGLFLDATLESGLGPPSLPYTAFGAAFLDLDHDGALDLLLANGAVRQIEELVQAGDPYPLHQPNQLFRNRGDGRFVEATAEGGPAFGRSEVSRGAAVGDLDGDGDADVVVTNNSGPARLLINRVGQDATWLGARVLDAGGADAIGARVEARPAGGAPRWRRVHTAASYASAHDPRILVGLAGAGQADLAVRWPNGGARRLRGMPAGVYLVLSPTDAPSR